MGHQFDGLFAVELGGVHFRRVQLGQRCQLGVGLCALAHGIFERVAVLEDRLAVFAGDPLQEGLGFFFMLAGGQYTGAGDAHKGAWILVFEVVQLGVFAVFAGLGLVDKAVVVINNAAVDLAGVDDRAAR